MKKLTLPLAIGTSLLLVYAVLWWARPDWCNPDLLRDLLAACLAAFSVLAARLISHLVFDIAFKRRKGREAPALLRVVLSIIAYSVFFVSIYSLVLNRNLSGVGFVATSTIVSVILGLALQDTLGNFFAGISIHVEQPFHIGDAMKISDMLGKVEAVTWRTTTIRTNNNTVIIFPNSRVAREPIEVFPYGNLNRHVLRFPAPYSIAPQRVASLIREAVATLENVAAERTPVVRVGDFSDSSMTYEILYWTRDYMCVPDLNAKIRERIWYVFQRNTIEMPLAAQHLLVESRETRRPAPAASYDRIIGSVDLFEPLTAAEKAALAGGIVSHTYAPGELILRSGDPGDSMFIVRRGEVEVRLPATNGSLQQVAVLTRGGFFGEMALFTGEPRNADVHAVVETEILEIRKAVVEQLLNDNAELAEGFSLKIAERQARLAEYLRMPAPEDNRARTQNILLRIKRFFSLR